MDSQDQLIDLTRVEREADVGEQFREIIAASEQLSAHLADAPTEEHRAAVVDIHAYLELLSSVSELPRDDVKVLLRCRRENPELPNCEITELRVSQEFLALAADLALTCETKPEDIRAAIDLAARVFPLARRNASLVREALACAGSHGATVRDAIRGGDLVRAAELMRAYLGVPRIDIVRGDGRVVPLEVDVVNGLAQAIAVGYADPSLTA